MGLTIQNTRSPARLRDRFPAVFESGRRAARRDRQPDWLADFRL